MQMKEEARLEASLVTSQLAGRIVSYLDDKTPRGRLWGFGRGVRKVVTDSYRAL